MDRELKEPKTPKPKLRHPDRITLLPAHLEKMDGWIRQVTMRQRGVKLTRNDIIGRQRVFARILEPKIWEIALFLITQPEHGQRIIA